MKKLVAIVLSLMMVCTSVVVFTAADNNGFVASPSLNDAPQMTYTGGKDDAKLVITAYKDRATLPEADRTALETAYKDVVNAANVTDLNEALAKFAKKKKIAPEELAVSDLFDISCTVENSGKISVKLTSENLHNFVALLRYTDNGWELVKGTKLSKDGKTLSFKTDEFCPFAFVVFTGEKMPKGCGSSLSAPVITVVTVALAGAVLSRRKEND